MKLTRCVLLFVMLGTGMVKGEDLVHWDELVKIVREAKPDRSREYTVVTKAGEKRKMRQLLIFSQYLQIAPYGSIRRDEVSEIQIRHQGRRSYFGWLTDKLCPDSGSCLIPPMFLAIVHRCGIWRFSNAADADRGTLAAISACKDAKNRAINFESLAAFARESLSR